MTSEITIVTAFFDIGRGGWSAEQGYAVHLERSSDQYFEYFKNLAILKNKIIVFTSDNFKDRIKSIRGDLPTEIICLDLDKRFKTHLDAIERIMISDFFKSQIKPEQLKNPECWSPKYVLINNLKSYFVCKAIRLGFVQTEAAAWVDFGYFRSISILNNITLWQYPFNLNKVNLFTIKKKFPLKSRTPTWSELLNSKVYFIGGCTVTSKATWLEFHKLVWETQQEFIENGVVDDDQNIVLKTFLKQPDLFKVNFLGKNEWFALFAKYGEVSQYKYYRLLNFVNKVKEIIKWLFK